MGVFFLVHTAITPGYQILDTILGVVFIGASLFDYFTNKERSNNA